MTVFLKDLQDIQNIQNDAKAKQVKAKNLKNQADNLSMEVCCDLAEVDNLKKDIAQQLIKGNQYVRNSVFKPSQQKYPNTLSNAEQAWVDDSNAYHKALQNLVKSKTALIQSYKDEPARQQQVNLTIDLEKLSQSIYD